MTNPVNPSRDEHIKIVASAVKEGRIEVDAGMEWVRMMDADPVGTKAVLAARVATKVNPTYANWNF